MLKMSDAFRVPLILLGHSPTEQSSFTSENLYDQARLKAILKTDPSVNNEQLRRFFNYKKSNYLNTWLWTRLGRFGRKVNILWYQDLPGDREIGKIVSENIGWKDASDSEYTRHFDCLAEPFTNYIREQRLGYSRRLPQLSTMIREGELTRSRACDILEQDQSSLVDVHFGWVKKSLEITDNDIQKIISIPVNVFSNKRSVANWLFGFIRSLVKGSNAD